MGPEDAATAAMDVANVASRRPDIRARTGEIVSARATRGGLGAPQVEGQTKWRCRSIQLQLGLEESSVQSKALGGSPEGTLAWVPYAKKAEVTDITLTQDPPTIAARILEVLRWVQAASETSQVRAQVKALDLREPVDEYLRGALFYR